MNEKFTPGPWEVQNGTDVFTGLNAKRRDGVASENNDGWHVADCSMGVTFDTDGQERTLKPSEMVANAHLIAAAPDLYEAVKRMCNNALDLGCCHPTGCGNCKSMAAIKKALGES